MRLLHWGSSITRVISGCVIDTDEASAKRSKTVTDSLNHVLLSVVSHNGEFIFKSFMTGSNNIAASAVAIFYELV